MQAKAEAQAAAMLTMQDDSSKIQQQEEEMSRMHAKIAGKVEQLREQAKVLAALQAEKKQLEEQVGSHVRHVQQWVVSLAIVCAASGSL